MPYGKFKMGKDDKKKKPDVGIGLPDQSRRRGAPKPPSKPAYQVPVKGSGRKIGRPVPPKKVR